MLRLLPLILMFVATTLAAAETTGTISGRQYWLHVPAGEGPFPMLVWAHPGSGQAEPQFRWWLQQPALRQGAILLAPQAQAAGLHPRTDGPAVAAMIKQVVAEHPVDTDRIVLGGHSAGGHFTYAWGLPHRSVFSALVPAAGAMGRTPAKASPDDPVIRIYHSTNDQVVPYEQAEKAVRQLEQRGYDVALTTDDIKHNIGPKLVRVVLPLLGL